MKAEIAAIDDPGAALSFALGCVTSTYGRRLRSVSGALAAMRWSLATATVFFAVMVLANAHRALIQGTPGNLAVVFGAVGLAFLVTGVVLARFGPASLAVMATLMLAVNTVALWTVGQTVAAHAAFYRALAMEGYLLWSMLLLAGLTLSGAMRSARLNALARARGWDA